MNDYLSSAPDLADFVRLLSRRGVNYLVVGGHAVGFHSSPRATKDLDIWLEPSEQNRQRLVMALEEYGAPPQVAAHLLSAKSSEIVWFGRPPNRIDLMQTLPGVDFEHAAKRAVYADSGDQKIPVIGIEDLIQNKQIVGRDRDKLDVKHLRRAIAAR
ncbi:MAG: hypothetical protein H6714_10620 [Myxococcales bacterium]|nr:hypothetical protein [Myxococcales bacterium]